MAGVENLQNETRKKLMNITRKVAIKVRVPKMTD